MTYGRGPGKHQLPGPWTKCAASAGLLRALRQNDNLRLGCGLCGQYRHRWRSSPIEPAGQGFELDRTNAIAAVRAASFCTKRASLFRLDSADLNVLAAFHLIHAGETRQLDSQLSEIRERVANSFDFSGRNMEHATEVLPYLKAAAFSRGAAGDDEVARLLDAAQSGGVEMVMITREARGAFARPSRHPRNALAIAS